MASIRHFFKNIKLKKISAKNKKKILEYGKSNIIQIDEKYYDNICFDIDGINNTVIIEDSFIEKQAHIHCRIHGNNNKIIIKKGFHLSGNLGIIMGANHPSFGKIHDSELIIDENTSVESMIYYEYTSNTYLKIGKNCMIAFDVTIYNTDAHPILDLETKKLINIVKGIEIGNHCWIGAKSSIMKNVKIPDDCIVGWSSVVTSGINKSIQPHSAIGGNPAKVVKTGITWEPNGAKYNYAENIG